MTDLQWAICTAVLVLLVGVMVYNACAAGAERARMIDDRRANERIRREIARHEERYHR